MPALLLASAAAAALPAPTDKWQAINPGGRTICGKGTKFQFLVKKGTVNKLLVEFMGGGACFSGATCSLPEWIPVESAAATEALLAANPGLHNKKGATADWHAIYVPYCTGDGHTGNRTAQYVDQKVHHMGGENARATLAYAFEHFPGVEATLTAGQSAGAVGSYMWAPVVMHQYPSASHAMLADSYAPLFGKTGVNDGVKNWDLPSAFPASIVPALADKKYLQWFAGWGTSFALDVFRVFPAARFGMYASNGDTVETAFYSIEGCGVEGCSWKKAMRDVFGWVTGNATNAYTYIGPGSSHTQTITNGEYSMVSDGVLLSDWIDGLVIGSRSPQRVVDCAPKC